MSSAEKAATILPSIDPREFRILQAIELGMTQHEFVPNVVITKYSGLVEAEVEYWLTELDKKELLWGIKGGYNGFILNYISYDLLALNALAKAEILIALGVSIGVGKEADVFEAYTPKKETVAIKFHRLGRASFRDTRRKRSFIADRKHLSWLYQSRLAAEMEYSALCIVHKNGVSVPEPINQNRHTIVMKRINGAELSQIIHIENPEKLLELIIKNVRLAYKSGVIHGDLSEFNILIQENEEPVIIDWPQYINVTHPNSNVLIERDMKNILSFFKRKFKIDRDINNILEMIKA